VAGDEIVTMQPVVRSLLRLRLALSLFGTGPVLAGALLAAAALLWLGLLPGMSARVADETRTLARLRALPVPKPVVPAPVLAAGRLADFYAGLGDSAHTGEIVMRLFEAAAATGVTLDKAEYKPGHDAPGRFDTYTIVLPVKGDYARLRQFSEKVLVTVPYAALDDMRFKRNSANDPGIEANLLFTAFLRPVTIAPVSESAVAAAETAAAAASAPGVPNATGTPLPTTGPVDSAAPVRAMSGAVSPAVPPRATTGVVDSAAPARAISGAVNSGAVTRMTTGAMDSAARARVITGAVDSAAQARVTSVAVDSVPPAHAATDAVDSAAPVRVITGVVDFAALARAATSSAGASAPSSAMPETPDDPLTSAASEGATR
jgi:hypothetical protein